MLTQEKMMRRWRRTTLMTMMKGTSSCHRRYYGYRQWRTRSKELGCVHPDMADDAAADLRNGKARRLWRRRRKDARESVSGKPVSLSFM